MRNLSLGRTKSVIKSSILFLNNVTKIDGAHQLTRSFQKAVIDFQAEHIDPCRVSSHR